MYCVVFANDDLVSSVAIYVCNYSFFIALSKKSGRFVILHQPDKVKSKDLSRVRVGKQARQTMKNKQKDTWFNSRFDSTVDYCWTSVVQKTVLIS